MAWGDKKDWVSTGGIIILALLMPVVTKMANSLQRYFAGAEGQLAAISIETNRVLGTMPRPWEALAQGGEALNVFLDSGADKVAAIRVKHIRIDHLYDGFNVVSRDGGGLKFDWSRLDTQVEKIRAAGALPFFSLSYMPLVMSKSDIVDEPKDWNEWSLVVQRTIEHYSGEKGLADAYYEVWNEPDLFGGWKMGGAKDYKNLYLYAARGAGRATGVQPFKLGGPGTTGLYKNWMDNFFPFILQNKLRLDFFSWHRYDLDLGKYAEDVDSVNRWIDSHPYFASVEKVITEMGPSSDKNPVNKNALGAAHLIATTRELLFKIKYGLNFSVKDAPSSPDGWGLLDSNNNPSPRYTAMTMLAKLGEQRLAMSGEGTWVRGFAALKDNTAQVLLVDYDPKGSHSEVVPVSFIDLAPGSYTLKQTWLSGVSTSKEIATTAAILQHEIPMTPNSVVLVELTRK